MSSPAAKTALAEAPVRSLTLRIYLSVVAVVALYALGSWAFFNRQLDEQHSRADFALQDRMLALATLLEPALPEPAAPAAVQQAQLEAWARRLRVPLALDDALGRRMATSLSFERRSGAEGAKPLSVPLADGRVLHMLRLSGLAAARARGERESPRSLQWASPLPAGERWRGLGLILLLGLLFVAVAGAAWPVARALTRRLGDLRHGVQAFGQGHLAQRVAVVGRDEVAAVARSFNEAAERIEALVASHRSLLANASHELRSPLARLKMALALMEELPAAERGRLQQEAHQNIAELDALIEEILLASRLDAQAQALDGEAFRVLPLLAEEAARCAAVCEGEDIEAWGDERLLRRAARNLLENAQRYGGDRVSASVHLAGPQVQLRVCDRGPGVPEAFRERVFEAFFRMPGHAERAGGVGLGLSLVRQIAHRHGGRVWVEPREGGGSCFVLEWPRWPAHPGAASS
jgi:signal transduction histidine kinase